MADLPLASAATVWAPKLAVPFMGNEAVFVYQTIGTVKLRRRKATENSALLQEVVVLVRLLNISVHREPTLLHYRVILLWLFRRGFLFQCDPPHDI